MEKLFSKLYSTIHSHSSPKYDDKFNRMKWVGNVTGMRGGKTKMFTPPKKKT
jgi:hypothetical protein